MPADERHKFATIEWLVNALASMLPHEVKDLFVQIANRNHQPATFAQLCCQCGRNAGSGGGDDDGVECGGGIG